MPSTDVAAALHKARHAVGGADPLTPADIGALPVIFGAGHPTSTAEVGTFYVDSEVTAGARLWMRTGSAWIVIEGDTGWRSATLQNGWAAAGASANVNPAVRRVGRTVYVRLRNLDGAAATNQTAMTLPAGFVPPSADGGVGYVGGQFRVISVFTNGTLNVPNGQGVAGLGAAMSIALLTDQAWPGTLPGTAA